jgi:hypothetical protein
MRSFARKLSGKNVFSVYFYNLRKCSKNKIAVAGKGFGCLSLLKLGAAQKTACA